MLQDKIKDMYIFLKTPKLRQNKYVILSQDGTQY